MVIGLAYIENYWMFGAGALRQPRGMERGGRKEGGSGWGTHVYLWWIHVNMAKPIQYYKVIGLQLKYINLYFKNQTKIKEEGTAFKLIL